MDKRKNDITDLDFTYRAKRSVVQTLKDPYFRDRDYSLIYALLRTRMRIVSFSDYLKRYIYKKAEMKGRYQDIPLSDYQMILCEEFSDRQTPCSFTPTSMRLKNAAKNWLEQQTVNRQVVLLLGFGLGMCVDDVNTFLTKALQEYELNAKDPFEVICWYCYRYELGYIRFESLWDKYRNLQNGEAFSDELLDSTVSFKKKMLEISNEKELTDYLSLLPDWTGQKRQSVSARRCFDRLYSEARELVAGIMMEAEKDMADNSALRMEDILSSNDRLYDYEKLQRIRDEKGRYKRYIADDISPADIENVILSAVPKDKNGNLTTLKGSSLEKQFLGKRLTRQRLTDILSGNSPITRYDLLTLLFLNTSGLYEGKAKERYLAFIDSANRMLNDCNMGPVYIANPYECFLLMCLLSDDPLGTYADVWELSYSSFSPD